MGSIVCKTIHQKESDRSLDGDSVGDTQCLGAPLPKKLLPEQHVRIDDDCQQSQRFECSDGFPPLTWVSHANCHPLDTWIVPCAPVRGRYSIWQRSFRNKEHYSHSQPLYCISHVNLFARSMMTWCASFPMTTIRSSFLIRIKQQTQKVYSAEGQQETQEWVPKVSIQRDALMVRRSAHGCWWVRRERNGFIGETGFSMKNSDVAPS